MTPTPAGEMRPLDDLHKRAAFSCGDPKLDEYFRFHAGQSMDRRTAAVWVWTRPPSQEAIGYYTLTSTEIDAGSIPPEVTRKLKLKSPPRLGATLLGGFAISSGLQRQGLGRMLCMHAFDMALKASRMSSSVGVVLDAYSPGAKEFWKSMEFTPMGEREGGMERFFLPMAYIEKLFRPHANEERTQ